MLFEEKIANFFFTEKSLFGVDLAFLSAALLLFLVLPLFVFVFVFVFVFEYYLTLPTSRQEGASVMEWRFFSCLSG